MSTLPGPIIFIDSFRRLSRKCNVVKGILRGTMLEHERINGNWRALCGPGAIVEIVKGTTEALIEDVGSTKRKRTVIANRETSSNDSTCLRRSIELELIVGGDVASTALLVFEHTILECNGKRPWLFAIYNGVTIFTTTGRGCDSAG